MSRVGLMNIHSIFLISMHFLNLGAWVGVLTKYVVGDKHVEHFSANMLIFEVTHCMYVCQNLFPLKYHSFVSTDSLTLVQFKTIINVLYLTFKPTSSFGRRKN